MSSSRKSVPATEMGILFSAPMIRAILAGQKTQTRRVIDPAKIHVLLPRSVYPDFGYLLPLKEKRPAKAGRHRAVMHGGGAVAVRLRGGSLGVKPGEFHFDFGFVRGETVLADRGTHKEWLVLPTPGAGKLWVRETWGPADLFYGAARPEPPQTIAYRADKSARVYDGLLRPHALPASDLASWNWDCLTWKPSIYMERWMSRIDLLISSVRLQRLHDITEQDAIAEGVDAVSVEEMPRAGSLCRREDFAQLWEKINGKMVGHRWADNPWVAAITFVRVNSSAQEGCAQEVAQRPAEV